MKMMKKLSLLLAVVMLISSMGLTALAGSYLGTMRVVNCNEWVTLRSYASTSAGTVCRVPLGATVTGYYYNSEFTECYYNGYHGYILSKYLTSASYTPSYTPVYTYSSTMGYIVNCNEWVSLRSYASTSASRLAEIPLGGLVEICGYSGDFAYCYYDGMYGYVLSQYVMPTGGYNCDFCYVVNCNDWVSLRSSASTSASRICEVPLGAIVECYDYNYEFSRCYYDGNWGYILNNYLSYSY